VTASKGAEGDEPITTATKALESTGKTARGGGHGLATARLGWGALVGLSLGLFALSVPARYEELSELARQSSARLAHGSGFLPGFLDGGFYAPAVLALEVAFVLALALISASMARRNSSDWRPLLFSAAFVSYAVWATPTLDALALPGPLQTLADLTQAAGLFMAVLFFLLFADGRLVPGWTRLSALGWVIYCLLWGLFPDAPLSLIDPFGASFAAFLLLMMAGWLTGLAAQAVRYRRGRASAPRPGGSCSASGWRARATRWYTCREPCCRRQVRPGFCTTFSGFRRSGCSRCPYPSGWPSRCSDTTSSTWRSS
jgi:hypothetical protein